MNILSKCCNAPLIKKGCCTVLCSKCETVLNPKPPKPEVHATHGPAAAKR